MARGSKKRKAKRRVRAGEKPRRKLKGFAPTTLSSIEPRCLIPEKNPSRVDRLFLSLCVVFNDLRDIHYFVVHLASGREAKPSLSPYSGQYRGTLLFLTRLGYGIAHELLELLRGNRNVIEGEYFQSLVAQLESGKTEAWRDLQEIALTRSAGRAEADDGPQRLRTLALGNA